MHRTILILLTSILLMRSNAQPGPLFPEGMTVLGSDTIYCEPIQSGDTVEAVFYVANLGKEKFWIYQIHPSCQCTAPQYANDTFYPGRRDSVVLLFHSKKEAESHYEKSALVLTPLGEVSLYVKGEILYSSSARKPRKVRVTNRLTIK